MFSLQHIIGAQPLKLDSSFINKCENSTTNSAIIITCMVGVYIYMIYDAIGVGMGEMSTSGK